MDALQAIARWLQEHRGGLAESIVGGILLGLVAAGWRLIFRKRRRWPSEAKSFVGTGAVGVTSGPSAQVIAPTGGTSIAAVGPIGDLHVGDRVIAPVAAERRAEATTLLLMNVRSTGKRLKDMIANIEAGNFTSPELRKALAESRDEFHRERSKFVLLPIDLLETVEHWHDDIAATKDSIADKEDAWGRYANSGAPWPKGFDVLPGRRRIGEFQDLLARGDALVGIVGGLVTEKPQTASVSDASRARERVTGRIELTVGQLQTLDHNLQNVGIGDGIETVLRDIEKLASEFSHDDLQEMGSAAMGKNVIAYYRDVRTAVERIRELGRQYDRARTLPDAAERMLPSRQNCQAHVSQGIRSGNYLIEQIRAMK